MRWDQLAATASNRPALAAAHGKNKYGHDWPTPLYSFGSKHSKIPMLPSCSAANRSRFLRMVQLTS